MFLSCHLSNNLYSLSVPSVVIIHLHFAPAVKVTGFSCVWSLDMTQVFSIQQLSTHSCASNNKPGHLSLLLSHPLSLLPPLVFSVSPVEVSLIYARAKGVQMFVPVCCRLHQTWKTTFCDEGIPNTLLWLKCFGKTRLISIHLCRYVLISKLSLQLDEKIHTHKDCFSKCFM